MHYITLHYIYFIMFIPCFSDCFSLKLCHSLTRLYYVCMFACILYVYLLCRWIDYTTIIQRRMCVSFATNDSRCRIR